MKIYSHITNGHLSNEAELCFYSELSSHEGKDIVIDVQRKKLKISNEMHAYYRDVVLPICVEHYRGRGYNVTQAQVHKELKQIYGPDENIGISEPVFRKKPSMADYTKQESYDFVESIKRDFAQEGTYIPDPNEHLRPPIGAY